MRAGCLLLCALISSFAQASLAMDVVSGDQDLRRRHQDAAMERQEEKANCVKLQQDFQAYDLYGSAAGSARFGVDVLGKVWVIERRPGPRCALKQLTRLERQFADDDLYGDRILRTFYYESNMLCEYTRPVREAEVKKRCYQPLGVVNKFSPYFLH